MTSKVSADAINEFLGQAFAGDNGGPRVRVTSVEDGKAIASLPYDQASLRPGGVISGPVQMSLADSVAYFVVFTKLGITPYAVTSNLNINFLNPCKAGTVVATGTLLKLGKRLAVIEVDIREESMTEPASHAIVTYALPSAKSAQDKG